MLKLQFGYIFTGKGLFIILGSLFVKGRGRLDLSNFAYLRRFQMVFPTYFHFAWYDSLICKTSGEVGFVVHIWVCIIIHVEEIEG